VQRLGGSIGADPTCRDGARIWFTLPTVQAVGTYEAYRSARQLTVPSAPVS